MGKPVSEEVQWIIIRLSTAMSRKDIAMYTGVSLRKVNDVMSYFNKEGTVKVSTRQTRKPHTHSSLCDGDVQHPFPTLEAPPDLLLDELRQDLEFQSGKPASISTIWRILRKAGFTMIKLTPAALKRNAQACAEFGARIGEYTPDQLVFVDESAFDRRTKYRGYTWCLKGHQPIRKSFFFRGRRFSVLPGLSLTEGILHCDIVEGSFDTRLFHRFIERILDQMQPYPAPNSVIVMDNAQIHKHPAIIELIHERGMRVEFLPPCSPDYNPIDLTFSAMKYHLRRNGEYARLATTQLSDEDIYLTLLGALYEVTASGAFWWFRDCGYV